MKDQRGKDQKRNDEKREKRNRRGRQRKNEEKTVAHSSISPRLVLTFGNQLYTVLYTLHKEDRVFGSG
jgi:hypothetical protein